MNTLSRLAVGALLSTVASATIFAAQRPLRPADVDALPSKPADTKIPYGTDPLQYGELRLPKGKGPFKVAVVIHGGCWVSNFATLQNTAALSDALRDAEGIEHHVGEATLHAMQSFLQQNKPGVEK